MHDDLAPADRVMLIDLQRAARAEQVEPCLIGAAALRIALQRRAGSPLPRTTRDWDFAVAVPLAGLP
jgi:predicted nucleotidyltransferase